MRILWLAHRDPLHPNAGGAEKTIHEVCRRLISFGNDVTLLSSLWGEGKREESIEGIKILRIGGYFVLHLKLPILLLREKFDIVINDLGHAIPWVSAPFMARKNIVFFRHLHARSLQGQVNRLLAFILSAVEKTYFLIYRHANFITESTTSIRDLNGIGIKYERITKIEPGVDKLVFHSSQKTNSCTLIYFGGMRKYKRPEDAIHLTRTLINTLPDLKMYVVGYGPELENLQNLAKELELSKNVVFTGRLSTTELAKLVAKSWLNVHTSVTEGWGYSILEASSAGTPTVAYGVPGVVDVIEDKLNGIKVKDGDRRALAEAAIKILSDPEPWWSSSLEVAKKFSWDVTAQKWQRLLLEVIHD